MDRLVKVSLNEVIGFIENASFEQLQTIKDQTNIMIESRLRFQGSMLRIGDRVFFTNSRSRKLPIGNVTGTVLKVNIKKAKIDTGSYGIWNVPFTMLKKI